MTFQIADIEAAPRKFCKKENLLDPEDITMLKYLSDGKGTDQIAALMGLSRGAIAARRIRLCDRLGVHNTAHAVAWGFRNHYLR